MTDETLDEIFMAVFELDAMPPREQLSKQALHNWDSMAQVNLVSALENEFDVVLELDDASAINSWQSARTVLQNYL